MADKKALKLPDVLIVIGRAVEVKGATVHYVWSAKDNVALCVVPAGNVLYCLQIKKQPYDRSEFERIYQRVASEAKKGEALYRRWHDWDSETGEIIKAPRGFLFNVDRCQAIVYSSDKWSGRQQKYIHEFRQPPIIWANHKTKPKVVMLRGGNIRTTKRGLTG